MKRSIVLFCMVAIIAVVFASISGSVNASRSDTCCQKFRVVPSGGPLSGCVVSVITPELELQCIPNANWECEICNIPSGSIYTAEVNCDGGEHGETPFAACQREWILIYVK